MGLLESILWQATVDTVPDDDVLVLVVGVDGDVTMAVLVAGIWTDMGAGAGWEMSTPPFWADLPAGPGGV